MPAPVKCQNKMSFWRLVQPRYKRKLEFYQNIHGVYFFCGARTEAKTSYRFDTCCMTKLYPQASLYRKVYIRFISALITKPYSSCQQYHKWYTFCHFQRRMFCVLRLIIYETVMVGTLISTMNTFRRQVQRLL